MTILFLGDIVGRLGRQTVKVLLPELLEKYQVDLTFANAENLAGGRGITAETLDEMLQAGVDYFTSGNHVFYLEDWEKILADESYRILRPANYPKRVPGRGWQLIKAATPVLLINLAGTSLMKGPIINPFDSIDEILSKTKNQSSKNTLTVIDFHAEVTSEKRALGFYVDGRVNLVAGTHTHIPSADTQILPKGTAYVTDVGMIGSANSVLGVEPEVIIQNYKLPLPTRFKWVEKGPAVFNAVLLKTDPKGQNLSLERIDRAIA